ncbi:hypothetical protein [Nocardia blacklockiae]|uniref:hypothetical protein n=1 Tax=Nocardia blacklockiae TaxID=480036 RepID=UPI001893B90A|nr:hypothetical protein [Nocardia blacklockiae]MBF6173740.1 hypothetical protein [Nocardia blacklockiae]
MTFDRGARRLWLLAERASRAGYRLMPGLGWPGAWVLLDAEDGVPLYAAETLDLIEQWLSE